MPTDGEASVTCSASGRTALVIAIAVITGPAIAGVSQHLFTGSHLDQHTIWCAEQIDESARWWAHRTLRRRVGDRQA